MPRDPNTILACLAGAACCCLFYGTFRVLGYIGRLMWAKRAVPLDPVDAQLDSNPVEERTENQTAADFLLWEDEYARREDRWSK